MKTRVSKITNLIFSMSFCLVLQSCNKEDFYEKEYLDNPFQNDPVATDGSAANGSQGGDQSGVAGGTQGGVDSGATNGGTTGSTTGSTTSGQQSGGTTDGSATGGSTVGGVDGSTTSGGTDGSATGGSTVGGTDGSVTSGSTDGSATGGSTTGGVDGSTTSGSTTGSTVGGVDGSTTSGQTSGGSTTGSTTGGSTTGSTTGGTTGGTTGTPSYGDCNNGHGNDADGVDESNPTIGLDPKCKKESFHQASSQTKKLDIVWIIDDSGSMADEQQALGTNFSAFIDEFITKDVDFKMAITTTDASSSYMKGRMVSGSDTKLTSAKAKQNEAQFKTDFKNLVKVGTSGSGYEKGLDASQGFMQKYASTFVRPEAYLAVVVLSDEEDQSANVVKTYTDYLKSFKAEAGLVKVYTIADINKTNSGSGITTGADRYIKASEETAGVVSNIRDDFHRSLSAMGDSIINLLDSFALANDPVPGTLKVYINGNETTDYTFDAVSRSIKFDSNRLPPVGAEIEVYYIKQ